ncbi:carboxymuconolactone decarboxylase family protein [Lactiplantibacillus herbarum]|uniref:carboxymuconolactone decarboxylase family protein n=1 Tax=Lactiplantibacillus herbarum TaxID=1670446 RepID=UPI0006500384|nr:carboxymuconolactone decarboxylase family protein [Lactiplantibacillus herbarum]
MEKNQRFVDGQKLLAQVDAEAADNVMDSLKVVAPDVSRYILEFAFGDIYARPGLSLQQREMITLTTLLTQGDTADQLDVHVNGALNVGLKPATIVETVIQCIPYVGFPKVLNALTVIKKILQERHLVPDESN